MGHHGHGRIVCVDARVLLLVVCADHQCQILAGAWANNRTETMANSVDISHPITVFPWRVVLGDGLCVCPLAVHALLHQLEHTLWPNASMALAFTIYLLVASLDWFLNRRLDARLNSTEPAQHYELWLYHRDGSRTCYARANERASLELLQHWLKAQQQRYFDAHPAQLTHTQLTGRL